MSLGKKTLRAVLAVLEGANDPTQFLIDEIRRELKPKKFVVAAKKRMKAKKAARQDEWAQIREKVLKRAGGSCEHCNPGYRRIQPTDTHLECDHMFGGSDRKSLQSIFTVWVLCSGCHKQKTLNIPSRTYWLGSFIHHATRMDNECNEQGFGAISGYVHAANIAIARLDSLRIQGRAD